MSNRTALPHLKALLLALTCAWSLRGAAQETAPPVAAPAPAEEPAAPVDDVGAAAAPSEDEAAPAAEAAAASDAAAAAPAAVPAEAAPAAVPDEKARHEAPPSTDAPPSDDQDLPFDRDRPPPPNTVRPSPDDGDAPPATPPDAAPSDPGFSFERLTVGLGAGYALRLHSDERTHGGAGALSLSLPIYAGFGVAGEGLLLGWGPSEKRETPLGFLGGSLLLTYVFDDMASTAILGIGPLGGMAIELDDAGGVSTGLYGGALLAFAIRFPIAPAAAAELGVKVPFILYGPEGFVARLPLTQTPNAAPGLFESQFLITLGLTFDPFLFTRGVAEGKDPMSMVLPFADDGSAAR